MKTPEMIELAVLDSFALLDEPEQLEFQRAFDEAPEPVRAQVRREQARFASLGLMLPDVEPAPELRDKVLGAVRSAIAQQTPLRHTGGRVVPEVIGPRRVSPLWRAVAIGFMTASVVLGGATLHFNSEHQRLISGLQNDRLMAEILQEYGSDFTNGILFDQDTQRYVFSAAPNASDAPGVVSTGMASIWHNPSWTRARFFCSQLPETETGRFRLALLDQQGSIVREITTFRATGGLVGLEMDPDLMNAGKLAVLVDGRSAPLLVASPSGAGSL